MPKKQKVKKWKCHGCGATFYTKTECKKHISDVHWSFISQTAGLGSMFYRCEKIEE
ncbi:hypothetical protein KAW18_01845 [candidate division WOR-3 bacterium]|nr:hypothetical protein [candidate division WOR-3 bacterium]